ncbi:MAG: hemolysin III family protein [Bifidobacteriaceae bacterium]|jgi:hemolysin III|nr:hemolysin III family protein [Bifidobacteriaceae bacterium]
MSTTLPAPDTAPGHTNAAARPDQSEVKPAARGWIHAVMFPLTIAAGIVLIVLAKTGPAKIACAVFAISAMMLFGTSATYHLGRWGPQWAAALRRLDHSNIALIIAGTYTPIALLLDHRTAVILLAAVWGGAIATILVRVFWLNAPRWSYVPIYIALGWVAVAFLPQFWRAGGPAIVWLLLAGGIAYTAGAVVYGLKRPKAWPNHFGFHEIFHACTVVGFTCHFIAVMDASLR